MSSTIALHNLALIFYGLSIAVWIAARPLKSISQSVAVWPAVAGFLCQVLQVAIRWKQGGHLPVTGLFETQHFLALWAVAAALYFAFRYWAYNFLPAAMGFAIAALLFASKGPKTVAPLTPAIDTPLFLIHVATSFAAYGLFGIAALLAIYRTVRISGSPLAAERRMLDECIYLGYILFTWCMIAGSLWAYLAWGSYWTWRIKGLWSWILWFYYSGVLHVRNRPGWQGWPVNVLAFAGFILVLFTYLGLGLLFKTSHPLL
ncbi:hypothetical protein EP232_04810 [bacterium]|nr:MAG: hypothetical protein EP232_04810 [bacterium]